MESLLSLAFDNISSRSPLKIRKGLRQIEGLLAQICLHASTSEVHEQTATGSATGPTTLRGLRYDLAFVEFYRLQESFQWNAAVRLTECLERLAGLPPSSTIDVLLTAALTVLQGILLLHPPSRSLFARENSIVLVLDLLDPRRSGTAVLHASLLLLVAATLERPENVRIFEAADGVRTVAALIKSSAASTAGPVKSAAAQLLKVYLMPDAEAWTDGSQDADAEMSTPLTSPSASISAGPRQGVSRNMSAVSALSALSMASGVSTGGVCVDTDVDMADVDNQGLAAGLDAIAASAGGRPHTASSDSANGSSQGSSWTDWSGWWSGNEKGRNASNSDSTASSGGPGGPGEPGTGPRSSHLEQRRRQREKRAAVLAALGLSAGPEGRGGLEHVGGGLLRGAIVF